jgi:hypothetical protein
MIGFKVYLSDPEREALYKLAEQERRDLSGQAAIVIRDRLIELGYLSTENRPKSSGMKDSPDA